MEWGIKKGTANDPKDTGRFMDQAGSEGVRKVSGKGQVDPSCGPDDRCGGRKGRCCEKADVAKPMHSLGSGVFEIALPFKGDAFRVVYVVQLAEEIWVVHAFQKKSTHGIATPQREIDLIKDRVKRLKEMLR